jgi:hypothetical protein
LSKYSKKSDGRLRRHPRKFGLHKLAKLFKMLKIKDFDQNKEAINEE